MTLEISYLLEKKDMIVTFDGLLDPEVCSRLLSELRPIWNTVSYEGATGGGLFPATKLSRDCALAIPKIGEDNWNDTFDFCENEILAGIASAIAWYRTEFDELWAWTGIEDTGFQMQQYLKNFGYYRQHVDSMPGHWSGNRVLSCIVYLNTVTAGGETEFPLHEASVKPVAGRIVLFPATFTHPHAGRPAFSEDKWIISTFICNQTDQPNDVVDGHAGIMTSETEHNDHDGHTHEEPGLSIEEEFLASQLTGPGVTTVADMVTETTELPRKGRKAK